MEPLYNTLGAGYATNRRTDPRIAAQIHAWLEGAESILNLGAGSGSYEPPQTPGIALEPSPVMLAQRPAGAWPAVRAEAEQLPLADGSVSHAMTVLSMHHWGDRQRAFAEIRRVTRRRFVALTWDPDAEPYWLTRDYFPEIYAIDRTIFPALEELSAAFEGIEFHPVPIPATCVDGFTAAFWARPHAYLDAEVRRGMSTFAKIRHLDDGLQRLRRDLDAGHWQAHNGHLCAAPALDVGYRLAVWTAG